MIDNYKDYVYRNTIKRIQKTTIYHQIYRPIRPIFGYLDFQELAARLALQLEIGYTGHWKQCQDDLATMVGMRAAWNCREYQPPVYLLPPNLLKAFLQTELNFEHLVSFA